MRARVLAALLLCPPALALADSLILHGDWCRADDPGAACPHARFQGDTLTFADQPDTECHLDTRAPVANTQAETLQMSCIQHNGRDGLSWFETWLVVWDEPDGLIVIRGAQIDRWTRR